MADDNDTAHAAIRAAAKKLEEEGVALSSIADALLVIGINSAVRDGGKELVLKFLKKAAAMIRAGRPVENTRH